MESFGAANLSSYTTISPVGLYDGALGTPTIGGQYTITGAGNIASQEALGAALINQGLSLSGVASQEAFGTARVNQGITGVSVGYDGAVGTPSIIGARILPMGIPSAEAFGDFTTGFFDLVLPLGIFDGIIEVPTICLHSVWNEDSSLNDPAPWTGVELEDF
jgi:hypothetical protein